MAFPGVTATETDLSGITSAGITGIPAGVIGTAEKGPAFVPTSVGSLDDWQTIFGGIDGAKFGPMAASQWLSRGGTTQALTYIRVLGVGDGNKRGTTGVVTSAGMLVGDKIVQSNGLIGVNPYANPGSAGNPGTKGRTYFLATFMSESAGSTIFSDAGIQGTASSTQATSIDALELDDINPGGAAENVNISFTIPVAAGGAGTITWIYVSHTSTDGDDVNAPGTIGVGISALADSVAATTAIIAAINGTASGNVTAATSGNGVTGGVPGITATAGTTTTRIKLTMDAAGSNGNLAGSTPLVSTRSSIVAVADNFAGGVGSTPAMNHAVPILRGVIMVPSGVTLSLSGNYSANSNISLTSTTVASSIPAKGGMTGSVKIADSTFTMLLNGFKSPSADVKNIITASFSNTAGGTFFPNELNTEADKIEHFGHYLYTWYDIPESHAVITGSGILAAGVTDGADATGAIWQDAVILTTGSLSRTGSPSTGAPVTPNYENFKDRFRTPFSPYVMSQKFGGVPYDLFRVHTFADGTAPTLNYKVTIHSLAPSADSTVSKYGTFSLTLRLFDEDDTTGWSSGVKTWPGLSLDPTSDGYIAKAIGDQYSYFDFDKNEDSQKLVVDGDYPLQNAWIRVEMSDAMDSGNVPGDALPVGFRGPHHLVTSGSGPMSTLPKVQNTGYSHGTALTTSVDFIKEIVEPPIPMREHICTGEYGVANTEDSNFTWGIQFELKNNVNTPNTTATIMASADAPAGSGIDSYTKYFPRFWTGASHSVSVGNNSGKPMVGGTVLDSDVFNNNKFTLENLHVRTGSDGYADPSLWHSASYKRNGKMPSEDSGTGGWLTDGNPSYKKRRFAVTDLRGQTSNQNYAQFTFFLQGGWDGTNIFDDEKSRLTGVASYREMQDVTNQGGTEGPTVATYRKAIDVMGNTSDVDIQLLTIPGQFDSGVTDYAIDMVESRFDALYLMDIPEKTNFDDVVTGSIAEGSGVDRSADKTLTEYKNRSINSSFVAAYYPEISMYPPDTPAAVQWMPASVATLGAYALNDYLGNPWSAPAGYTRGLVDGVDVRNLIDNEDVMSDMYAGGINLIISRSGAALAVWGQKTGKTGTSSLNRVNVRRLLISVRRSVKAVALTLLFEPNRSATLSKFESLVNPILQTVQEKSGVNRFKVVIDTTTTTQADIENNTIRGKIFLEPTRTAEYISLDFTVTNSDQFDSL